jgi:hypothetical protein
MEGMKLDYTFCNSHPSHYWAASGGANPPAFWIDPNQIPAARENSQRVASGSKKLTWE